MYVPNGIFIAAALHEGFPVKQALDQGEATINAWIGVRYRPSR